MTSGWVRRASISALVAVIAAVVMPAGGAQAAANRAARHAARHGQAAFEGRYGVLHSDPSFLPDVAVLQSAHGRYELHFPAGTTARPAPGAEVRIVGRLTGKKGRGGRIIAVNHVEAPAAADRRARPRLAQSGAVSVLVIMAQWTAPDAMTADAARQQILVDDAAYFREASYGQVDLSGDVTGWLRIPPPGTPCSFDDISTLGGQAALAAGFDPSAYDRVVVYFPHQDCSGIAGQAMIGGPMAWINGHLDRRVTLHELGHTFGLYHAHLLRCTGPGGAEVTLAVSGCDTVEYGDPFDAMGESGYGAHYSAAQKDSLGWLGPRLADLTVTPTVTLSPFESDAGATVAAKLAVPTGRTYYFEYRRPVGFDADLPAGELNGVLVHLLSPSGVPGPDLLDLQSAPPGDAGDAALPLGQAWTVPEGWTVTATAVDGGVRLQVGQPSTPPNDDWAAAPALSGDRGSVSGTTAGATAQSGEPAILGRTGAASVWYRYQAPANGSLTVDTAGSGFDTLLGIYTGAAVDGLTAVAENDDDPALGNLASRVGPVAVRKGVTYSIAVAGFNGDTGGLELNWAFTPAPAFTVNDVSVKEGDKGTTSLTFTVTRAGGLTPASSVDVKTVNGSAVAGKDYVALAVRTITFAPGEATKAVTVVIKNDRKKEKKEAFYLNLSNAVGATIADPTGVGTIVDNDR